MQKAHMVFENGGFRFRIPVEIEDVHGNGRDLTGPLAAEALRDSLNTCDLYEFPEVALEKRDDQTT